MVWKGETEMMDFLKDQPHPECSQTRCTTDNGRPIEPAAEVEAELCCALCGAEGCWLFVVPKADPRRIDRYVRQAEGKFVPDGTLCSLPAAIRSINAFWQQGQLRLFALADKGYLMDSQGTAAAEFALQAEYASAYWEEGQLYLICDGVRFAVGPDNALASCGAIRGAAYRINANRYDALTTEQTDIPGDVGGTLVKYRGIYLYLCAQTFTRCARENLDTFLCEGADLDQPFSRRYLLLPNGGAASLFEDQEGELWAAFVGSTPYSAVYRKPAVVRLDRRPEGFWRPCDGVMLEDSVIDRLPFSDNGGVDIRDTFVYPAPDGWYYLTGTTARPGGTFWKNTNGVCLWRSKDLERWEFVGNVFDYGDKPEAWQNQVGENCWAPEMCWHQDTYWITYSIEPGCGLLKSLSGRPEGPYADCGRVVMKGIDSGFFRDEDGTLYLVWQNGRIAPFTPAMNAFAQEPQLLLSEDGRQVGYEGAGIIKVEGKYVLYAAEWNGDMRIDGSYDMMYAVSDSLWGPYSPRRLLVPHGGHGCLFYDHQGQLRFTMFGNDRTAPFSRKAAIGKVEVCWEDSELILRPCE